MKVIKSGSPHGWSAEFTCTGHGNGGGGCEALLLVTEDDLYQTVHEDYGGGKTFYTTFTCMSCGVKTDVVSDGKNVSHEIPRRVREKARTKRQ